MTIFLRTYTNFFIGISILNNIHIRIYKTIKIHLRLIFEDFVDSRWELMINKRSGEYQNTHRLLMKPPSPSWQALGCFDNRG